MSFCMVDRTVLEMTELTPGDKVVHTVLSYYAKMYAEVFPSYDTIAAVGGVSKSTVKRAVKKLSDFKLIEYKHGIKDSNVYRVYDGRGEPIRPLVKRSRYVEVNMSIMSLPWMSPAVKMVYAGLLFYDRMDGGCHPSLSKLAKLVGMSRRAVFNCLKLLKGSEFIKSIGRRSRSFIFEIIKTLEEVPAYIQQSIEGFFTNRLNDKRKESIKETYEKVKQILNVGQIDRKAERLHRSGEWLKAKIGYAELESNTIISKDVLEGAYKAIYGLAIDGVKHGYHHRKRGNNLHLTGDAVKALVDRVDIDIMYHAIELVYGRDIDNLVIYLKIVLIDLLARQPGRYYGFLRFAK